MEWNGMEWNGMEWAMLRDILINHQNFSLDQRKRKLGIDFF